MRKISGNRRLGSEKLSFKECIWLSCSLGKSVPGTTSRPYCGKSLKRRSPALTSFDIAIVSQKVISGSNACFKFEFDFPWLCLGPICLCMLHHQGIQCS
ncbi:hypothetical protein BDR05DRAFT_790567 [Suillus weaverae]|nr:hypothetical protein BDR05DRAFT_790567 [Suillus weaverae]